MLELFSTFNVSIARVVIEHDQICSQGLCTTISIASQFINLFEHRIMPRAGMMLFLSRKIHFPFLHVKELFLLGFNCRPGLAPDLC